MSTIDRADLNAARARASRIRSGIHNYLETLAEIARAYAERDWTTLGYADWQSYVDEEFAADRLRLPPAHRQKAVEELRLAGMSTRAIGAAIGASEGTVRNDLTRSGAQNYAPETVQGADGKTYAASAPAREPDLEDQPLPLGQDIPAALAAAIEGTVERVTTTEVRWSPEEEKLRESVLASETVVASLRGQHVNLIRWAEDNGLYVRIDRRTEWGNPFEIPGDGDRTAVIDAYAYHYLPHKPSLLAKIEDLRGKVLGCWCAPEACHGDVIVDALEKS